MNFADLTPQARAELIKQANQRYRCKDDLYRYLDKMLVSTPSAPSPNPPPPTARRAAEEGLLLPELSAAADQRREDAADEGHHLSLQSPELAGAGHQQDVAEGDQGQELPQVYAR